MAKYKKRKDGRYATSVALGYDDDGSPKKIVIYGKTQSELDMKKAEILTSLKNGTYIKNKNVILKDYADKWLKTKSIGLEHATIYMYESIIKNHVDEIGNFLLSEITKSDIQIIINSRKDKARTCQKIKITLNQIFNSAIDDGLLHKNPCKNIVLPKNTPKEKRVLNKYELELVNISDFTDREKCYINLLKNYGLRKEEALALNKKDFNFKSKTLKINKAVYFKNNRPYLKNTKSSAGNRNLPILSKDVEFLKNYFNIIQTDHIFSSLTNDDLITEQSFKRMFESIIKKMNSKAEELNYPIVENLTSHIFRHNFATTLYKANIGIKEAQYLMGHSNIKITMDIYTHLDQKETNKTTASKLESYFESL